MRDGPSAKELVIFTPLPPRPNGIADYAYPLLAGLAPEFPCTVVIDNDHGEATAPPGVEVMTAAEYAMQSDRLSHRLHIYQLGNNPDHFYMLPFLADRPGIAVLHDPSLHDLLDGATVRNGDVAGYVDALEAEHGRAGRVLGEQFRRYHLRERRMFFDMPMIRGIAAPARGVIVHSRYAAVKVLARASDAHVTVVPHHYIPPPDDELDNAADMRRALGVPDDAVLLLSVGFVTRAKCIDAALRALAIARDRLPPFRYVVAGALREDETDVKGIAAALGLADVVLTTGYVPERKLSSLIRAADVIINLRHPVAGETSGTMIRALGAGGCLVVVDRGAFAEIPDDAAVRIAWRPRFEPRLAEALVRLAHDRDGRRRIGRNAAAFIARNNRLDLALSGYRCAIEAAWSRASPPWACEIGFEFLPPHRLSESVRSARAALGLRALPQWFEAGAVPACGVRVPRTLLIGRDEFGLLDRLGYARDGGSMRHLGAIGGAEGAAAPARTIDLAIVLADAAAGQDPARALAWLNRMLAYGGVLVWHVAAGRDGRPARPFATSDAMRLFEAYGFRVDAAFTARPPQLDDPPDAPGDDDERCWRLFKVSETFAAPDFAAA